MNRVSRPAVRYLGGKFLLAPWIISHFPPHRHYVEPFGGGASVLLRKPRSYSEVYNDLDGEVVNLFAILRDRVSAIELVRLISLTPFAREEWRAAYAATDDPIERARRLLVRSFMGHGSCASRIDRTTGWRFDSVKGKTSVAQEWATYPDALLLVAERFSGVAIENRPALDILRDRDDDGVLFYVDPPYVHSTRSPKRTRTAPSNGYRHELTDLDHVELIAALKGLRGSVVLSGYPSPIYDHLLADWTRVDRIALADGGRERTEVMWLNASASRGRGLFAGVAA